MIAKYGAGFRPRDLIRAGRAGREACAELARQMEALFGGRHVVLFSSARGALECLLRAIGGEGRAALPAYTCIAVPEAVERAGWQPLLVDIAPGSVNMTRGTLEAAFAPGTRAVILTHQFGIPSIVEPIVEWCRQRGIFVVEDAAAALGARYAGRLAGTWGDAAIVSFGLTKVAPAGGVGALLTDDAALAQKAAALRGERAGMARNAIDGARAWAWMLAMEPHPYAVVRAVHSLLGHDPLHERVMPRCAPDPKDALPCSAFAAALAGIQLARLPGNIAGRQELARIYREELAGCEGIGLCSVPVAAAPVWMQFPVFVEHKERCYRYVLRHGVDLSWTFRYSCGESYGMRTVPNSDQAAVHVLGLPTHDGISSAMARNIGAWLRQAVRA